MYTRSIFDTPCDSTPRRSVITRTSAPSAASSGGRPTFSKSAVTVLRRDGSGTWIISPCAGLKRSSIMLSLSSPSRVHAAVWEAVFPPHRPRSALIRLGADALAALICGDETGAEPTKQPPVRRRTGCHYATPHVAPNIHHGLSADKQDRFGGCATACFPAHDSTVVFFGNSDRLVVVDYAPSPTTNVSGHDPRSAARRIRVKGGWRCNA